MNRRTFTATLAAAAGAAFLPRVRAADAAAAVEQAHAEMWRRFVDQYGIVLDFTDLDGKVSLPTPEECREGKPNALGWWAPIENGAMFNGLYMDGAIGRWQHTHADADAAKARKLMDGLLKLASISDVPGFVGRGVSTDGRSHYPMGSNDQTSPWFFGLWRYLGSGLATAAERERIKAKLVEVADAIVAMKWTMPAERPFGRRGSFNGFEFDSAPRLLFVTKFLHELTGDAKWDAIFQNALHERGGAEMKSRLESCESGMVFHYAKYHSWTSCTCVAALRALWEMEKDETVKAAFARGLRASADLAEKSLPLAEKFDVNDGTTFNPDWRVMNTLWKPQQTEQEAQDLAHAQLREFLKASPRRAKETEFVREPASAAWVVALAPEISRERVAAIERVIARYHYARLYYSTFFWVEGAWWRSRRER